MSNSQIIDRLLAKTRRTDIPAFKPGDTVRVHVKIKEGDKERLQAFEGLVIARSKGAQPSFTVRKMSFGQGVERIFPINSKVIDKIDVLRSAMSAEPSCIICARCVAKPPACAKWKPRAARANSDRLY